VLHFIFCLAAGYLIGSFPTAYVVVRHKAGVDIRKSGSGNVGARNTFDVTGSKYLGVIVLLLDAAKGAIATLLPFAFPWGSPVLAIACGMGAIAGHNYPVWLRFHGGRGLATAVGVMLIFGWMYILLWCLLWTGGYLISRSILRGNILASLFVTPVLLLLPEGFMQSMSFVAITQEEFLLTSCILCILILLRHHGEIRNILTGNNT
jgi:acyl phosphate:glycerol-3-phosphate acyltransferase